MQLTQGIHRAARISPDKAALLSLERTVSWAEFENRVARLAAGFRELGVSPGERVAMLSGNSDRYVEYYFATLWAGAVMVPVNTRWSMQELAACLNDAAAVLLLVDTAHCGTAAELRTRCPTLRQVLLAAADDDHDLISTESLIGASSPVPDAARRDDDLAALFYTGGTTGRAKGVMLSHANLMANSLTAMANMNISGDTIHLHVSPMFHVAGGARLFSVTVAGGTHAVIPTFEPELFLDALERFRVTLTVVVPTMLNRLVNHPGLRDYDLSSLEMLSYGASPMPEALLERAIALFPDVRFLQSYGMTELSPVATVLRPRFHVFDGPDAGFVRSAGQPVYNADVTILDDTGNELEQGEVGEICVRGPMVMQGYWQQPELTAQTLRGGWMHTGDAGYIGERGFLFLVDRIKDMIVTGGENVYSAEVENVLYQHAAVAECAVIGIPSADWGEAVHAVVTLRPGMTVSADDLLSHCRSRIAGYKCPKSIELRGTDLPKNGAGKILKVELRKPFWDDQSRSIN
jgi:long-chain acyl-CoA synthetase